jgi:hypothetical protein
MKINESAEIKRLRTRITTQYGRYATESNVDALITVVATEARREVALKYGQHHYLCQSTHDRGAACDCGFAELTALEEGKHTPDGMGMCAHCGEYWLDLFPAPAPTKLKEDK